MSTPPDPLDATRATPRERSRRVGPYRVEGELGRGGMGVVLRAFDERLHRPVALKALPAEVAADPGERARLEHEARALALVNHPNVGTIHGIEESEGTLYLVLELVEGETLRARLDRGAMPVDEALAACAHVAAGVAAVHRKGLVHRDLKPSNVMVAGDGHAKLLDFGLARRAREGSERERAERDDIVGTPGWMSPEQLRGEELDARSDAWAWGCLLYECLAGAPAFPGATWAERDRATLQAEPEWSLLPEATPGGVVELMRACLSKDRTRRPATMDDARTLLEQARLGTSERRATAALPKHFLPAERDAFVGREAETAELGRLLGEGHRLVTVLGLGGTGKTRLVVHHARRTLAHWPGGAWFCDLSEARSVEGIAAAVAAALDVPTSKEDPIVQLGHAIAGRGRCLVVLDNFEQVARHAGDTVGKWLDRCGEACFVVTTREVLGLPGEQALALSPMQPKDAEALFVARARQAKAGYEPDGEERKVVAQLVKLLDHLPLAVELAAARVRVMPTKQVLARMGERFKLLAGAGARRDRQATLRATLDWSWDLLTQWEKSALAQVSVFEGGFTLEAAEAVLDLQAWPEATWSVDVVQALLDKSLVRRAGEDRLDLLVSVQEYAAEKLAAQGGRLAAEHRHGAWFATFGTKEAVDALGRHGGVALRRALARELDNLVIACRRAVARNDADVAVATLRAAWPVLSLQGPLAAAEELASATLALPLVPPLRARANTVRGLALESRGHAVEARRCLEAALATHREEADRSAEVRVLADLGRLHHRQGRIGEARAVLEPALTLVRAVGDRRTEAELVTYLGLIHSEQGRLDEARACFTATLAMHAEDGGRLGEALALVCLGNVDMAQGRAEDAMERLGAALAIHREVGDRSSEANTLGNLATLHFQLGRLDEAKALFLTGLALQREIGDRRVEAILLGNLGSTHAEAGSMEEARACLVAALAIHREVHNRRFEGVVLANLGLMHDSEGRVDEARACLEAALACQRDVGDRMHEGMSLASLAGLHVRAGRLPEAHACFEDGERLLRAVGDPVQLAFLLCGRLRLEHDEGRTGAARALLVEAESLAARAGVGADSPLGRDLAQLRARLAGEAS